MLLAYSRKNSNVNYHIYLVG